MSSRSCLFLFQVKSKRFGGIPRKPAVTPNKRVAIATECCGNKGFRVDIEFIELEHRQNVLKLMEICGIEMKEAYDLYTASGYNFEASINRHFNPAPNVADIPPQIPPEQNFQPYDPHHAFEQGGFEHGGFYEEDDIEYQQFKQFKRSGKAFDKKYPVRPKQSLIKSFIPKFLKGQQEHAFKQPLQKFIGRKVNLKVDNTNLSESFNWCWKQKFPIAVILLDFKPNSLDAVKRLFSDDMLIQKVISEQFKAHGIDTSSYVLEEQLKPFFNLQRDANSIVICRVNHLDEINVVTRVKLDENIEDIRRQIKQAKSSCIQNQLDQSHIIKQFHEELRGNFNYQRPKTIKQNIKMREDKKLRKQQEQQFFKACQPKGKKEQQKPQQQVQPQQQKYQHKRQIKPVEPPSQKKQQPQPVSTVATEKVLKAREQKLARLKKYNDGVTFKIRFPSGSNKMVTVDKDQYIRYLFDFIECQPDDLGFNNEGNRNFDIYIGFGGTETLKGKESKRIKDIFEDSEVLIVREL